jgi:hypothetical protein
VRPSYVPVRLNAPDRPLPQPPGRRCPPVPPQAPPPVSGRVRSLPAALPVRLPARLPVRLPFRLAAVMVAVTAAATGCVNVGEGEGDTHRAGPSHSAGQPGGAAPDGMSTVSDAGSGYGVGAGGDGKHGHGGAVRHGHPASPPTPPAREVDGVVASVPARPGSSARPTPSVPAPPTPTRTPVPTESPAPPPETSAPPSPPPPAEPSSSAHEGAGPQLADRQAVPAPVAGAPAFGTLAEGPPPLPGDSPDPLAR